MMNELHAGLHARYLEERQEVPRCTHCGSKRIRPRAHTLDEFMADDTLYCQDCERMTPLDVETFEEWAERNDIYLEEL